MTHICQAAMQPRAFQECQPADALPLICPQVTFQLDGQLVCISLYSRHSVVGESKLLAVTCSCFGAGNGTCCCLTEGKGLEFTALVCCSYMHTQWGRRAAV